MLTFLIIIFKFKDDFIIFSYLHYPTILPTVKHLHLFISVLVV